MTDTNTLAPTDEAIMAWAMSHQTDAIKVLRGSGFVRVARAVLAKWAAQPAALPARMLKPAAWAATNAEGIVEALGMNQSRRFDTPLHTAPQVQAMLAAAPSGPALEPLTDEQIEAAWDGLQARRALKESADFRARIGVPCSRCEGGTYRADHNGYSQFHRCNKCRHVPMWEKDGSEFGITAAQEEGDHG